jgi:general secretion pathway protein G
MRFNGCFRRLARAEGGFTLIELILVTVIIAVLAGMVTLSLRGTSREAKIKAALGDIKSYQTALDLFALDHNDKYPKALQELVTGKKKYLRDLNEDPWGNLYVYLMPGEHYPESFDMFSMGPDGVRGTADDVAPWLAQNSGPAVQER